LWNLVRRPATWYVLGTLLLLLAWADVLWPGGLARLARQLEISTKGIVEQLQAFHGWSRAYALAGFAYIAAIYLLRLLWLPLQERLRTRQPMVLMEVQFHRQSEVKPGAAADFYTGLHGQLLPEGAGQIGLEEVAWFLGKEGRVAWLLTGTGGRAHSYLFVPRKLREVVTATVQGLFPGLDLSVAEDPLAEILSRGKRMVAGWKEYALAADSMYPLRVLDKFEAEDPLGPLSVAIVPQHGVKAAELAVIVRPVADRWKNRGRKLLHALRELPAADKEKEQLLALEQKADAQGFDVVVRVTVIGEARQAVREQRDDIGEHLKRFASSAGGVRQSLVPTEAGTLDVPAGGETHIFAQQALRLGLRLGRPWPWPPVGEVGEIDEGRRRALLGRLKGRARTMLQRALRRLPRRYFPPLYLGVETRKHVLNPAELATLAHNPHRGLKGNRALAWQPARALTVQPEMIVSVEGVPREEADAFAASGMRRDQPMRTISTWQALPGDMIVIGSGKDERGERRPVGVPAQELTLSWHILGEQGTGKTSAMESFLYELIRLGVGWCMIEAKGDCARTVPQWLPEEHEARLVVIDPRERHFPPGLNPFLSSPGSRGVDADVVVSQVMGMFGRLFPNWDTSIGIQEILRNALHALWRGEPYPTIPHLHVFLNSESYRQSVLSNPRVDSIVRSYWLEQVPNSTDITRTSFDAVRRRLSRFITAERTRFMFGQAFPTVDLARVLKEGMLVLAPLVPELVGEDIAGFIGAAMLTMWLQAAFTRVDLAEQDRHLYLLGVDEAQSFKTPDIPTMLAKFRSLGVGLMVSNQAPTQLEELRDDIESLTLNKLVFGVRSPTDAGHMARLLGGDLEAEDVQFLPAYHAYLQRGRRPAVLVATLPPPVEVKAVQDMPSYGPQRTGFRWPPPGDDRGYFDRLVQEIWWCDPDDSARVQALAATLAEMPAAAWLAFRRRRLERGLAERAFLLSHPDAIPNRSTRLVYLSSLAYGTPAVEVAAELRRMLEQWKLDDGIGGRRRRRGREEDSVVRSR
jgi:hypothetical protein